ncbi:MFS general substrate transporter [Ceraceosorus guamensis]|uniref:MFS general substrate transporter n=1 Tax=Ceraceosorus guamensis TaxID=1522189 RepID=A0A316W5S4_9BASI|nr:MFS general substrate transporter [Ceraceosorus guamensis]PWN45227.1 MFS general substrate transporter [Ceraceosorus guamensis]
MSAGGVATTEAYVSETQRQARAGQLKFRWASLWEPAVVNPVNGKSYTFPIFRFWDPYSTAFWLATLGFFTAFICWFAFAALMTEAVRVDLRLTADQVANSNLCSLAGTAVVRFLVGPAVDKWGPRKVLATLLVVGAIPSALVPTISNLGGLETIRFFISILGGTFVPTQAWTTAFFDKTIVGTANAFSGGWGNLGGGLSPVLMINTFEGLHRAGLSTHLAWRIAFLALPVPLLLVVAAVLMLLGRDHPAGKWWQRHQLPGTAMAVAAGQDVQLDPREIREQERMREGAQEQGSEKVVTRHAPAKTSDFHETGEQFDKNDAAQSEPLTARAALDIALDLRVWMVALSYCITFGLETAMDAALPQLIYGLFAGPSFSVADAAYAASTYGLLNLYARPLGGILCDILYNRFRPRGLGVRAKVVFLIAMNIMQGVLMIGLGFYVDQGAPPTLGGVLGFIVGIATTGFAANGAAYAVYPHIRPKNSGTVAGAVGAFGAIGGIFYTLIFKFHPGTKPTRTLGKKFWIAGIFNTAAIFPFAFVPLGDAH